MSEWYYQQDRCLGGPVSFTRLARLVVNGELTETDVVTRAGEVDWIPISRVVGLRRTCEFLSGDREYTAPVVAKVDAPEVMPVSVGEARKRQLDDLYHRIANETGSNGDDAAKAEETMSRRDAMLVWGPLGLVGVSVTAAVIYQMTCDPWKHRTYERNSGDQ